MSNIHRNLRLILFLIGFLAFLPGYAQQKTITGKVTDGTTGESLPGVSIVEVGTTNGTVTNIDGDFTINVEQGKTLSFTYIGYESQEVQVGESSVINIALMLDVEQLGEVVVIGYGQVKKEDATGSVIAINSEDFNKGSITSPEELVMGKIAGVQITTGGGAPGSGSTIRIRGGSSLSASNDPLFVIDGVPVDSDDISGMRNPLNTINPNDIETFTVLKDASATAIYGSRASNGVIIISTKKGKKGAPLRINYDGKLSSGSRTGEIDILTAEEFRALINERHAGEADVTGLLGSANTDWQDVIFQTAKGQEHNIGVTGSIDDVPFRVSLGYSDQKGLLKTSSMERLTGSVGLNPSFFEDHLNVNANFKGMTIKNRFADEGAIGNAIGFDPTQEVYDASSLYGGYFTWLQSDGNPNTNAPSNPLAMLNLREDDSRANRIITNIQFDYKFHFFPDLRANLNLGYDYSDSYGTVFVPENASWSYDPINGGGENRKYSQDKKNELLDFYLNYTGNFESVQSKLELMAGYSWQHFWKEDYVFSTNVAGTRVLTEENYNPTEYYLVSFFGRLNYTFKDRYLLTFTLRNDGTSRFSEDNRWGLFPAAAFAWQINDEPFLKNAKALSELKLRLGYGVTGQQNIGQGNYPYLATYVASQDNARMLFGNTWINSLRPDGYDINIKWEETTTYNVGLDFGFFKNRLTGSVDYYERETIDLLNVVPVAAGTNFTNEILTNVGDLTNKGVEFAIQGKPISKENFLWELGFNFTYNKNEITRLTATDDPNYLGVETGGIAGGVGNNVQIHSVGHPASSFFVYEQVYDEDGNPLEGVYVDRNGDGLISPEDKYHYKTPAADYFMGFNSNLSYKNWDFSFSGRINLDNYVYNNIDSRNSLGKEIYWSSGYLRNITNDFFDTRFEIDQYWSDYYVQNASFLRLDNITLGYTFNKAFNDKVNIRLYSTVQNVFVITEYSGLDPEVSEGIDNNVYPRPRTIMLGINVDF